MLLMRNCDTEANSPIFWEKDKNRVKDLMSVIAARFNLDRAFLAVKGLQMFLIGEVFFISNQIFLYLLNRSPLDSFVKT